MYVYPLNSKRITLAQLCQLAQAFDLPIAASSANLEITVQTKLSELEQDPKSIYTTSSQ